MKYVSSFLCIILSLSVVVTNARAQSSFAPELPRIYLDTSYPAETGATLNVAAGGNLQAALDAANPGDTVVLEAGATFTGNFVLPAKGGGSYIVIRSSAVNGSFPSQGTRVGAGHASMMPKILSPTPGPALATAPGAHHYRLVGLELGIAPSVTLNYGILTLGDASSAQNSLSVVPHNIVVDRCIIRGTPTANVRRGIALNSASTSVVDSYIAECHEVGADSQAICGWNGPGPYKIVNNHLEGAGENFMLGGADPSIPNLIPSDVEFRRNHCFKPLSWKHDDPSFAGIVWTVKNSFELKNAQRVLVDGNVFENNWASAQNGFAILFTVRNQDGTAPWSAVADVTFSNNKVKSVGCGVNILGTDYNYPSSRTQRIRLVNNLFENVGFGGVGRLFQIIDGADAVAIEHNTAIQTGAVVMADETPTTNFSYKNNLTARGDLGVFGSGIGEGTSALQYYFPSYQFAGNGVVSANANIYPSGNFFPSSMAEVGFVDYGGGNYRLTASSPYHNGATDGTDVGADIDAIEAAIAGGPGGTPTPTPDPTPEPPPVPSPTPDETAPVIMWTSIDEVTTVGAVVRWTTDEPANSQVEYGATMGLDMATPVDAAAVTTHAMALESLTPDTVYYYRILSEDAAGNGTASPIFVFRTMAAPTTDVPTLQAVSWRYMINCVANGNSLQKTHGRNGKADATASSAEHLVAGDGYVEFTVSDAYSAKWMGIGRDAAAVDPNAIDFCIRMNNRGKAAVHERGRKVGIPVSFAAGDLFRIAIENGVVRYSRNGVVFHTSTQTPVYPIYANAALLTIGSSIQNAMLYSASSANLMR